MEYLEFGGRPSQAELGRGLARMHLAELQVDSSRHHLCKDRSSMHSPSVPEMLVC
jgi:hypothetical protein